MFPKKLWIYPLSFGILGAFIGLVLRYAYTGSIIAFPFKNVLHAHSHVMLLGFIFNALLILVWINFVKSIDKVSFRYYVAMQICMAIMIVAFILQGYAFYSILFSTLHLGISYILLVRLWKRLEGNKSIILLVKFGIFFHFLSSLGPYALGPLMVLDMKESPWYRQAIFFYLHFQFYGVYFIWIVALMANKVKLIITKKHVFVLVFGLILLYAHSLDYNFNHWLIKFFGGLGSTLVFAILFGFRASFIKLNRNLRNIYYLILTVAIINIVGTFPFFTDLVVNNRFVLVAWLHFLFLGLYVPFIWVFLEKRIYLSIWILYAVSVILSEIFLIFPGFFSQWSLVSVMDLLFITYFGIFLSISIVHGNYIFKSDSDERLGYG